jgi:hypothetical protein
MGRPESGVADAEVAVFDAGGSLAAVATIDPRRTRLLPAKVLPG